MSKASDLVNVIEEALGFSLPVHVRAWDGSEAGTQGAASIPTIVVTSKRALRHVLWQPGELGLARAYVQGDLDVEGDLADALRLVWSSAAEAETVRTKVRPRLIAKAAVTALKLGAIGRRPAIPQSESNLTGDVHSRERDLAAISHHYDLSNDFYELLLDSTMAYSSAFWVDGAGDDTVGGPKAVGGPEAADAADALGAAQTAKLDLVCRKLGLRPGFKMLDIGCGWGSLSLHAAEHYGVHVTGVTLSAEQRDFVLRRADERGLSDRIDISLRHFRDLDAHDVDAVASIEMGEHVGDKEYVVFCAAIYRYLRPGGRVLIQQMSRGHDAPGGGPFIETYIAPDMHMKPLAQTIGLINDAGLEIRDVQAMRDHYPLTVAAWASNLEDNWGTACKLVGEETARVWRLYLAGGSLAFEQNRMGVDQILAVKPSRAGQSQMPRSPIDWLA